VTVSQDAMRRLMAYRWPGNVRQLENAVERALAFSQGRNHIDVQDLPPEVQNQAAPAENGDAWLPEDGIDFERYIEGVELSLIKRSLERTRGNKRQAARLLNLKRTTLIEKLKRLEPHQAQD
jgi:DNA-binding NtrC family response regulator